ncbi:hypothetical protein [Marinicrinis sediminis]|uniref:Uncharacterized protein n=1 Tax=Marinicrinis sediminis TaxID=1652465 RepID=A0ABW5R9D9_9BACL
MSSEMTSVPAPPPASRKEIQKKRSWIIGILFVFLWLMLVAGGVWGGKWYIGQMKQQVLEELSAQNKTQIEQVEDGFNTRMDTLQTEIDQDMQALEEQIQTFNELLTFANENATDTTDNSTQLYSQLSEIKKQLEQLKKNLDVLK